MSDEYRNALAVGTVLDTYRIERVLGEGGFGVTYLVTELNLGKEYAIKELIPDGVAIRQGGTTVMARSRSMEEDFEATRRHFIKEARVLDALKHPAIVAVHRLFEANGTCYMVMDYVEGETLGAHLKKQGGTLGSREEFEGIFYPIMDGLELLHGKEIIHRDIKPGNIMVSPDGSPVLLDFGASCRVENHTVTMTQMVSAGYSPFEQYMTRAKQGPYTDIYALGATMVRAITGAKPDNAADRMGEDFYQSLTEQEELVIEYGEELLLAIDAALLLEKSERPQSIEEWRELIGEEDSEEDSEAQYNLGVMYANGEGVEKDDEEAVKWYRMAADRGHASARANLGVMYANGRGVAKDEEEAVSWYRKAAEQDDARAQNNLGVMYYNGLGVVNDYVEAVKWYRMAADQQYASAQYNLGVCYANGHGVTKDDEEAVKWYRMAADQQYASAQYNLGVCYANGHGVTKDDEEAVKWYRLAADQGDASAQGNLGWMYANGRGVTKDDEEAVKWFRLAADQGDASAQTNLGMCYANGEGVEKDDEEAVKWFRLAAEQGHAKAQYNLGVRYENGRGVAKDDEEAVKWYRKAADQGHAVAQGNLGVMYTNGRGVTKDDAEAVKWFRKAAEQGAAAAQFSLGVMYANGRGVAKDEEEAVKWYRLAADRGNAAAQVNLGFMYYNGLGVAKDDEEAVNLYREAAGQGYAMAQRCLGVMYDNGNGVQEDDEEAVKWYLLAADQGDASAQYSLGLMYEDGKGVSEDYDKALDLYRKAADQGHEEAEALTNEFRFSALFSWEGRLGIKGFRISQLVMLLFGLGFFLLSKTANPNFTFSENIVFPVVVLSLISILIWRQRLHDLGKSGVSVIPMFIGNIYFWALLDGGLEGDNLVGEVIFFLCFLFYIFNYPRLFFARRTPDRNRSSA